jgi:hypothetical protein
MPDNEPIDDDYEAVARKMVAAAPPLSTNAGLPAMPRQSVAPIQTPLELDIEVERTVGGIEMGVLQDGTAYLTQTGLEEVAGISRSTLFEISREWDDVSKGEAFSRRSRIAFFHDHLSENGYRDPHLYVEIIRNGSPYYAYPDIVCMAFLEYFAFEALTKNARAIENYRNFARGGFQQFVYNALDYAAPDKWKHLHDRIATSNRSAPEGYFAVFNEVTGMSLDLIRSDLSVSDKTIPSVGVDKSWSDHWAKSYFDDVYGSRIKYEHDDAAFHSQSANNPQLPWAYPNEALAEFRRWFRHDYLTTRFPRYILTRTRLLRELEKTKPIGSLRQPKASQGPSA